MNLSFKAAYKDNTQRKGLPVDVSLPLWTRPPLLTEGQAVNSENHERWGEHERVGEDRQTTLLYEADGQKKTTQNWQPRNITREKWHDVFPEVKALWQEQGNCVIYFSMGMSAWGMRSDYKPLNDLMCGLIALIFNFTLLDFPVTKGWTSVRRKLQHPSWLICKQR